MLAQRQADGTLKVTIFPVELRCGGRYSKLLDASPRMARMALWKIWQEAVAITGFAANSKNITAEILPNREGGCVIYYSCGAADTESVCLQFQNSRELVAVLERLAQRGEGDLLCSLYDHENGFSLLLQWGEAPWLPILAGEYGALLRKGSLACARVREYGAPILQNQSARGLLAKLKGN